MEIEFEKACRRAQVCANDGLYRAAKNIFANLVKCGLNLETEEQKTMNEILTKAALRKVPIAFVVAIEYAKDGNYDSAYAALCDLESDLKNVSKALNFEQLNEKNAILNKALQEERKIVSRKVEAYVRKNKIEHAKDELARYKSLLEKRGALKNEQIENIVSAIELKITFPEQSGRLGRINGEVTKSASKMRGIIRSIS